MSMCTPTQTTDIWKEDFAKWNTAVDLYLEGKFSNAIQIYRSMHETSARISYNMAMAYMKLGDTSNACTCLTSAVEKDRNLAVAFFQRGTLYLQCKNIEGAISDLEITRMLLRGNAYINYKPLGLFCHLHGFTILFNLALAHLLDGDDREFRLLLTEATHYADYFQREQISDALRIFEEFRWSDIKPVQVSTDAVFAPPRAVTHNLVRKQTSKTSMVVFASDEKDNTPTFHGLKRVDELRMIERSTADDNRVSFKQKLNRIMKSSGDIVIPDQIKRNLSLRKQRHSTGSLGPESSVPYQDIGGRNPSKKSLKKKTNKFGNTETDSDGEILIEIFREDENGTVEHCSSKLPTELETNTIVFKSVDEAKEVSVDDTHTKLVTDSKRHFKGKAKSAGNIKASKKENLGKSSGIKSTGDLKRNRSRSLLPLEPKKKANSFFMNLVKPKSGTGQRMFEENHPTVVMHGCKAVGDLLTMLVPVDASINRIEQTSEIQIDNGKLDMNNNEKCSANIQTGSKFSLGSVFGDRSTVVKYALTEACDILTAAVTPTIDETEVGRQKNKTSKHHDSAIKEFQKMENQTPQPSRKKRRAPGPPKSTIRSPLAATGYLLTALMHQRYDHLLEDGTEFTELPNHMTDTNDERTNVKETILDHDNSNEKHYARKNVATSDLFANTENENVVKEIRKQVYSEQSKRGKKKVIPSGLDQQPCVTVGLGDEKSNTVNTYSLQLDMNFGTGSGTSTFQDENNNTMASKYVPVNCKEPETPVYVNIRNLAGTLNRGDPSKNSKLDNETGNVENKDEVTPEAKCIQQLNNSATGKKRRFLRSKKTKRPPPCYPPPPLRINARKPEKGKKNKVAPNGFIGNTLLASGSLLSAIGATALENDASNCLGNKYNNNHEADDISCRKNVDELCQLMNRSCRVEEREIAEEDHIYDNFSGTTEQCPIPTYVNVEGNQFRRQHRRGPAEKEPEVIGKMIMSSCNMLSAFVTSSQETRQAFEEFVKRQKCRKTGTSSGDELLTNDGDCDYENMA